MYMYKRLVSSFKHTETSSVGLRVRIDPQYLLLFVKGDKIWVVLQMRQQSPRSCVTAVLVCFFVCLFVCFLFVCSFAWGFSSHWRKFHSYRKVIITGEGLKILTYTRHLWLLSSEGSLACHTYCDTGHTFIIVISEDP